MLCVAAAAHAQDAPKPMANRGPVRISLTSKVTPACNTFAAPVADPDATGQLGKAGLTLVTNLHQAQLAVDIDCVAMAQAPQTSLAVHQCLGFSEPLATRTKGAGTVLANTWRKCEAFTCEGRKCDAQAKTTFHTLLGSFLDDYRERAANTAATAEPEETAAPANFGAQVAQQASNVATVVRYGVVPPDYTARLVIWSLYIAWTLAVAIYWRVRKTKQTA